MDDIITIRGVTKTYPNGTEALKGVDLSLAAGARFSLLGPNGAGKSTLVRLVTGLSRRDGGRVLIDGRDPGAVPRRLQRAIGVVPQENDLDPLTTPEDQLTFQGMLFGAGRKEARERTEELVASFDLEPVRKKKTSELSGGNKRRLHCALGLVHRPRLLFLDEPTTGMDPEARQRYWEVLDRANRRDGVTLFLTTQYLEEAEKHTDSLALLHEGLILFAGPVGEFKARVDEAIRKYFTTREEWGAAGVNLEERVDGADESRFKGDVTLF